MSGNWSLVRRAIVDLRRTAILSMNSPPTNLNNSSMDLGMRALASSLKNISVLSYSPSSFAKEATLNLFTLLSHGEASIGRSPTSPRAVGVCIGEDRGSEAGCKVALPRGVSFAGVKIIDLSCRGVDGLGVNATGSDGFVGVAVSVSASSFSFCLMEGLLSDENVGVEAVREIPGFDR